MVYRYLTTFKLEILTFMKVPKVNTCFYWEDYYLLYLNLINESLRLPDNFQMSQKSICSYFQNRNFDIYKNVKSQYVVFNGEHYDLLYLNLTYDCV